MKGKRIIRRIMDIVLGIVILGLYFMPWITAGNDTYNTFQYMKRLYESENIINIVASDIPQLMDIEFRTAGFEGVSNEFWCYLFVIIISLITIAVVLNIINMIFALFGRPKRGVVATSFWIVVTAFIVHCMFMKIITMKMYVFPAILLVAEGICFFMMSLADEWDELRRYNKEERRKRKERKRRLRFRGVYSGLYYKIMWQNLAYQWKDWLMFGISSMFVSALLYISFGIGSLFQFGDTMEILETQQAFHMVKLVTNDFVVVIFIVTVFVMTLSFKYYLKKRLDGFQVLLTLGIREKSLRFLWKVESIVCYIVFSALGLLLGKIIFSKVKKILGEQIVLAEPAEHTGKVILLLTVIALLSITWLAYNISRDHLNLDIGADEKIISKKESYVDQYGSLLALIWGISIVAAAIYCFSKRKTGENIWILAFMFLGIHHIYMNGWSIWLKLKRKITSIYIRTLTKDHVVNHNFVNSAKYATLLTILHISALSFFMIKVVTNEMKTDWDQAYPYDYMCLADKSDDKIFDKLESKCKAEIVSIPIMRVTSPDNDESLLKEYPMSFHIAISEKSYKKLKKLAGEEVTEELGLDDTGKNIYVVYQQDQSEKSKPLDWWMFSVEPIVYTGLRADIGKFGKGAGFGFDDENTRIVLDSEVNSLTGNFGNGDNENLIVFSNDYFKNARSGLMNLDLDDEIKGPTVLKLVNVPDKYNKKAVKILKDFKENHKDDEAKSLYIQSVYSKNAAVSERTLDQAMEHSVNLMIVIMLAVTAIFILVIKVNAEIPEMQSRYQYMARFGMSKKVRMKHVCTEVFRFFSIPIVFTVVLGTLLTKVMLSLRGFTETDFDSFLSLAGKYILVYVMIQLITVICLQIHAVRKVEYEIGK